MLLDFGYDCFIGKAIDKSGNKSLVNLDFKTLEIELYPSLKTVGYDLFYLVAMERKKVLLTQSPGIRKEFLVEPKDILDYLLNEYTTYDRKIIEEKNSTDEIRFVRPQLTFETLTQKELLAVKKIYDNQEAVKNYISPFDIQPKFGLDLSIRKN